MKKLILLAAAVAALAACKDTKQADVQAIDEELNEIIESDEYKENGLMKLRAKEEIVDAEGGRHIILSIEPDEKLKHIANENFGTYCDNRATVVVLTQGGDTLLARHLTKADMQEYIDEPLFSAAILDGLSVESVSASAIVLNASVSVPHSDEQAIVAITADYDGNLNMRRAAVRTVDFSEDQEED